jgi:hypothetical protein
MSVDAAVLRICARYPQGLDAEAYGGQQRINPRTPQLHFLEDPEQTLRLVVGQIPLENSGRNFPETQGGLL